MADFKDRQGGGYNVVASQFLVSTATSITAGATAPARIALSIHNMGAAPVYLGYGGAVATSTTGFPLVPSQALVERDFLGQVTVAAASGATSIVAVRDVSF